VCSSDLQVICQQGMKIDEATAMINDLVTGNTSEGRFITFFWGYINTKTNTLTYVNAGHNPPILLRNDEIKFLKEGTTIIGAFDTLPSISVGKEVLSPGSIIFNYTDGLVESPNEDVYISDNELFTHLQKNKDLSVDSLNENMLRDIQTANNAAMNSDDITILTIRVL
jgi:sigma-B regulation protein RsbU (phosphoserine phosphatase)